MNNSIDFVFHIKSNGLKIDFKSTFLKRSFALNNNSQSIWKTLALKNKSVEHYSADSLEPSLECSLKEIIYPTKAFNFLNNNTKLVFKG
ncbi:CLUMA_CG011126, isoform A [Clunio marinus]|uniref:CLUMA_CG011126, isoform A n=1 Tax=Clunio marinus TaxID=568069 RepID=A0A1J1IH32_9DIPT|nr:CLUMA_CG011126, isoform A [Clunio marinus]